MGCRARRSVGGRGGWIGRAPADPAAHFLPVEIAEVPDRDEAGAAPVGDETRIEIALADGVRVRVGRGVDGAALRRVLAALGR